MEETLTALLLEAAAPAHSDSDSDADGEVELVMPTATVELRPAKPSIPGIRLSTVTGGAVMT